MRGCASLSASAGKSEANSRLPEPMEVDMSAASLSMSVVLMSLLECIMSGGSSTPYVVCAATKRRSLHRVVCGLLHHVSTVACLAYGTMVLTVCLDSSCVNNTL